MTYAAGISFPGQDREPALHCDTAGCGTVLVVRPVRGGPPRWLIDGRAPKGWRRVTEPDGRRRDTCPRCLATPAAREKGGERG